MGLLGRLAGGIAHDFNNLLTVILGNLDLLDHGSPADRELCVRQMRRAAESGARLARQLQTFSRERPRATLVFDLNDVVRDVGLLLQRLIEERIRLDVRLDDRLRHICGDRGQFEQLILNLALNARDAIPGSGCLSISTANLRVTRPHDGLARGPYVVLTVTDDGIGMDAATRARVFEPYFSTKTHMGTGLGLTTVFAVVKESRGHIKLTSAPGRGTTFTLYFPATTAPWDAGRAVAPAAGAEPPETTATGGRTILIVEDDVGVRMTLQRMLSLHGYRVLVAAAPSKVVDMAQRRLETVDLLITDLVMPEMDGTALAHILKTRRPAMAVLFVSGYGRPADEAIPDAHYLAKPFVDQTLLKKVQEILRPSTL